MAATKSVHGELLTLDQAWRYLSGEEPTKASVIGKERLRQLMRRGFIRAAMSDNGKSGTCGVTVITRKAYIDEFLQTVFDRGLSVPDLGIEIVPFGTNNN